jgi:hypothetical protein
MGIAEFMIGLAEGRTGGSIDSTADSLGNWIHPLSAGDDEERQLRHCRFFFTPLERRVRLLRPLFT